jgi:acetyl esterase/lipase
LDVYRPAGSVAGQRRGIVVYVHGGGWSKGDKSAVGSKAAFFTQAGYLFVSVNYRLSPRPPNLQDARRVRFPDHPRDVAEAVAWLRRNAWRYGGDGTRIALIGHSAGAHLVGLVATDASYLLRFGTARRIVRGFVPLDPGAYDVAGAIRGGGARSILYQNAFGTPAEEAIDPRWRAASLLTHADPGDPPALIVQRRILAPVARVYAERLGGSPDAGVLPLDRTHGQINSDLGAPTGQATGENQFVLAFVRHVLGVGAR